MNIPPLSRWMIKSAFVSLVLGFTLGALVLSVKGWPWWPTAWRLRTVHIELMLYGWLIQFIMGVGYWIFPRFKGERGRPILAWSSYVSLNVGVILVLGTPFTTDSHTSERLLAYAHVLFVIAVASFILHAWPRIKPFRQPGT